MQAGPLWSRFGPVLASLLLPSALAACGSSSASSPTATPRAAAAAPTAQTTVIVVTPTSAPGKTVIPVTVVVTATPRPSPTSRPGHVTPLPGATAVPPASGLTLGMITRPAADVATLQAGADRKDKAYTLYLHPSEVIKHTLPRYGFKTVDIVSPPKPVVSYSGRPVRKAVVKYQGQLYRVYTAQPGRTGPTGIWVVVTILRQQLITGTISRPMSVVQRMQTLANEGKPNDVFRRNPEQTVVRDLPQYGFDPDGIDVVTKAHPVTSTSGRPLQMAVVKYQGTLYDVYVAQPGVTGSKGVWVIVTITPV